MNMNTNMKFDFDDILIMPTPISDIESRSEIEILDKNGMLPIFTAPMFDVISAENRDTYLENGINTIMPRKNVYGSTDFENTSVTKFISLSLEQFIDYIIEHNVLMDDKEYFILIDIANGHMAKLVGAIRKSKKKYGENLILMVGNIANPITYGILSDAGADYIRVGIGNGSGCLTTEQTAIGYPMASLIEDTYNIKLKTNNPAKIIADGGMRKFSDVSKALALGADYVMLGGVLNKALESASGNYIKDGTEYLPILNSTISPSELFATGETIYKRFRGMSTKSVQRELGNKILKTSEGVERYVKVEYTLSGWVENFNHYLKSAMSYTGKHNLNDYVGRVDYNMISMNAFKRYSK